MSMHFDSGKRETWDGLSFGRSEVLRRNNRRPIPCNVNLSINDFPHAVFSEFSDCLSKLIMWNRQWLNDISLLQSPQPIQSPHHAIEFRLFCAKWDRTQDPTNDAHHILSLIGIDLEQNNPTTEGYAFVLVHSIGWESPLASSVCCMPSICVVISCFTVCTFSSVLRCKEEWPMEPFNFFSISNRLALKTKKRTDQADRNGGWETDKGGLCPCWTWYSKWRTQWIITINKGVFSSYRL